MMTAVLYMISVTIASRIDKTDILIDRINISIDTANISFVRHNISINKPDILK